MRMLVLMFMLAAASVHASPDAKFEEANRAFSEGKYADAAAAYQNILDTKGASAELLYNLANAQLKAEQTGKAILNYERTLNLFSPRDPDVFANLKIARNEAQVLEPETSWLQNAGHMMSWNGWAWLSWTTLLALCLLAGIRFGKQSAPWLKCLLIANLVLAIVFIVAVLGLAVRWAEKDQAVVISKKAIVRISPFETAEVSFPVKDGEIVKLEQSYENFVSIRNRTDKTGWILKDQVERIVP